jgi:murein DD-endopeptidase MepM/ murein hydrolase activator NlpD
MARGAVQAGGHRGGGGGRPGPRPAPRPSAPRPSPAPRPAPAPRLSPVPTPKPLPTPAPRPGPSHAPKSPPTPQAPPKPGRKPQPAEAQPKPKPHPTPNPQPIPPGGTRAGTQPAKGTMPVAGKITSDFGRRTDPKTGKPKDHHGIDISAKVGTPVKATGSGTVIKAGWENAKDHKQGYGMRVTIDHGNGNTSTVGHLSETSVKKGDKVSADQVIGKSGNTGESTGPHVHYEERHNGKPHPPTFDPGSYKPAPKRP